MKDNLVLDEIPYFRDVCELYERLRDLPTSCLLDSSFPYSNSGRYDIVTADAGTDVFQFWTLKASGGTADSAWPTA
jgi:hypothetical protein